MKYYVFNTKTMNDVAIVDTVEEMINILADLTNEDADYLMTCWNNAIADGINSIGYRSYETGEVEG